MSFTPTNMGQGGSGMPDISVRMVPTNGGHGNYESQGVDRAVTIGQDGRPIGNVQYAPPFDLYTEENRAIIEQRRRQKEIEKRKKQQQLEQAKKPKVEISDDEKINSLKSEFINKTFQYITKEKFGTIVTIISCQMKDGEIEVTMDDGSSINLDDLESKFMPYSSFSDDIDDIESSVTTREIDLTIEKEIKSEPVAKPIAKPIAQPVVLENTLPESPLRTLLSTRKKNHTPISLDLTIDLVKRDFFKIIDDSYDDALDYVVEHVMSAITLEQVKEAIKYQLELYYKNEGRSLTNDEFEKNEIYKEPDTIILEKTEL